ncbi:MAG: bifunctional methylenetetrahydrofolate dehydrogenase/methenyltetrahydrofolate cyclohydrolase FolD [Algoriphagus sp.]|jgi:methylenetetrahydrofolate dehydrogenase (NADP+) / methenyltetrahydrofolate cyclohydrolase|uniref:bifunctional methylenetetrahydrofolate dehydrogenase/methenyltetrahydrofolate cyclohydrolase FolD n=3 Tax=Algoriphagus sp. TaxID=1872435 RepID=UPI0027688FC7|nr:bifunctional methylenetetrahydrofolate dehydrogenase/methenyltetrahydrofolate cyclohydrolase FolD [Algoriphagus sp.]MDP4747206.1 bifunctional methylenetetrahydrofolate dehydrogenase/methenyltetrahydrofolate cyclohydrolase FolD [Algoriphagus sp.]MDP4903719.1 bifunctional methylenetetrahydrofolate dehydrogenase/methenyltetrahydrofolate cyclohydrolase FolD [Algoriphagus sp.]MDP4956724.1 bifunctional methylenetetrahydrofolate dehydrogenase/methenyltetrahydrofolate cyclohydrolase FolD [Algoriphagu
MVTLIDGKKTAQDIKNEIAARVAEIKQEGGKQPHLAAILVGEDGASQTYVGAKVKACEEVGFTSTLVRLATDVSEVELLRTVEEINQNPDIDGLIVQLPLPKHISVDKVTNCIRPEKDVDGFTPANVGRMTLNWPAYVAATPYGIVELLKRYQIETAGKHCVVIGRSHIVGSPMSILMARNGYPGNATVTLTHSRTKDLASICRTADILIVAIGKPEFVTADMVKPGAVVIDVGIHRIADETKKSGFRLIGDVKFDEVAPLASAITPVPGGVGPMTIAALLYNTLQSAEKKVFG